MKIILQRVLEASCWVGGEQVSRIGKGALLLIGLGNGDTLESCSGLITRIPLLRIFDDKNGKPNLSLQDTQGEILAISQFTLYADCSKGRRPNYLQAMTAQSASHLFDQLCVHLTLVCPWGPVVKKGVFGADMKIHLINDGPYTLALDC